MAYRVVGMKLLKTQARVITPTLLVLFFSILFVVFTLAKNHWDPFAFVLIGGKFDPRVDNPFYGYDGQFVYQIAVDPANGWQYVDVPAYRYQRILYPMLVRLLSLGNPIVIPWILIVVNWLCLVIDTWLIEGWLRKHGFNPWYALSVGGFAGLWLGLRLCLTEPLAFLLVLGGIRLFEQRNIWASALCFALALLTREVTVLFALGVVVSLLFRRQFRLAFAWGSVVLLPFLAWQWILWQWFGELGIRSGGAFSTPVEWLPYRAWWGVAFINLSLFLLMSIFVLPVGILPSLIAIGASIRTLTERPDSIASWVMLLHGLLIAVLPRSILLDPSGLIRTLTGLVISVLFYGISNNSKRALSYSLLGLFLMAFIVTDGLVPPH